MASSTRPAENRALATSSAGQTPGASSAAFRAHWIASSVSPFWPGPAQDHPSRDVLRIELDGLPIRRDRVFELALLQQRVAEVEVGAHVLRIELDRAVVARDGVVEPAQLLEGDAEVQVITRDLRIDLDRVLEREDRQLTVSVRVTEIPGGAQLLGVLRFSLPA